MADSAMPSPRRHALLRILAIVHALLAASAVQSPAATFHSLRRTAPAQGEGAESPLPVFELHSGFWLNLHHFLYLQARLLARNSTVSESARGAVQPDEPPASLIDFPAAEIAAWKEAVAFYSKDLAGRDLLLNGDMENISNQLALMETCPDLEGKNSPLCKSGLRSELVSALERAAPVYRAHWWTEQDRTNRAWIAQIAPLIQQMGVELSTQLAEVYRRPWPTGRLRVDVVGYAGPYGAYTLLDPTRVTISSHDPRNRSVYGFEVLFHESSHALAGAVNEAIAREFRQRDKPIPRDLWHVLLFYTTGEMVRRDIEYGSMTLPHDAGGSSAVYQPYAARFGLYSGSWEHFRSLLDLYWRPYLDSRTSFETAMARLAAEM